MTEHHAKHGDTDPITLTVKDDQGQPVDLTGSTVRLLIRPRWDTEADTILLPTTAGPEAGQIVWTPDGTLGVGEYIGEVEITQDGTISTAPSAGFFLLAIEPDLPDPPTL